MTILKGHGEPVARISQLWVLGVKNVTVCKEKVLMISGGDSKYAYFFPCVSWKQWTFLLSIFPTTWVTLMIMKFCFLSYDPYKMLFF